MLSYQTTERLKLSFCASAVLILAFTLVSKLILASGSYPILDKTEPLTETLTNRQLIVIAAFVELGAVLGLVVASSTIRKLLIVAWIASAFLAYRSTLLILGIKSTCYCLGFVTIVLSRQLSDTLSRILLGYLLFGSLICLLDSRRQPTIGVTSKFP